MWAKQWIVQLRAEGTVEPNGVNNYERVLRTRVVPYLGHKRVTDIDRDMVKSWVRWMAGSHITRGNRNRITLDAQLSARSIKNYFSIGSLCLGAAAPKWIAVNPAAMVRGERRNSLGLPRIDVTGSLAWPTSLLLGRFDNCGVLRYAGQTQPIKADQRRDLAAALRGLPFQGAGSGHPWPCPLPASWSAGMSGSKALPFTPVEATLVAEVEVDTALDGSFGRIRHPCRHVRLRLDLRPPDVVLLTPSSTRMTDPLSPAGTARGPASR